MFNREEAELTPDECSALLKWFEADASEENPLLRAGNLVNAQKWFQAYGAKILGMMAARGLLEPGSDPLAVAENMIESYWEASQNW
jgi:hypothetical protein